MSKSIRNIAIFAHVDAGKTSITEQFLFLSGSIRKPGSVDKGTTQTDSLSIEKERGITVNAGLISFNWKETQINLIDAPGHVDFFSEVNKAILAIDSAVIVLSAVEGVQAQTESIISLLIENKKPFILFINKIDREGAAVENVLKEIETDLHLHPIVMQSIEQEGNKEAQVKLIWNHDNYTNQTQIIEKIVSENEPLFERYLDGEKLSYNTINQELINCTKKQNLIPAFVGSAKFSIGIKELLDAIVGYLPQTSTSLDILSGVVFDTRHVKGEGKWSAIRLFSGSLHVRSKVLNVSNLKEEKISIIKNTDLQKSEIIQSVSSGEIAWVHGLNQAKPGDFIGSFPKDYKEPNLSKPLLSVQLTPKSRGDLNSLIEAMHQLNNENPDLDFSYLKDEQELFIRLRGTVQKEILQSILNTRFGIEVNFSKPTVIYKETPTMVAEGYVRYWMPKPCWAIMRFKIEPGERGSGVQFQSLVGVNDIKKQYQNDVKKTLPFALKQGILGWEVDDIKITLIEGEDHEMHTKSNDFSIATPMGIMDGLSKAKMSLLEPILSYKIKAPEEFIGKITSELIQLRATINNPEIQGNTVKLTGDIPLATSLDFPIKLSAISSGKAKLTTFFKNYQLCDVSLGKTRDYKGISPLDRAKYILKARKALA